MSWLRTTINGALPPPDICRLPHYYCSRGSGVVAWLLRRGVRWFQGDAGFFFHAGLVLSPTREFSTAGTCGVHVGDFTQRCLREPVAIFAPALNEPPERVAEAWQRLEAAWASRKGKWHYGWLAILTGGLVVNRRRPVCSELVMLYLDLLHRYNAAWDLVHDEIVTPDDLASPVVGRLLWTNFNYVSSGKTRQERRRRRCDEVCRRYDEFECAVPHGLTFPRTPPFA